MAKDYSFDVVCRTDLQEAANAVNQASKEIGTRYDFKGSKSSVSFDGSLITLIAVSYTHLTLPTILRV